MINRFDMIRNVGRFDSYAAGTGTDLAPFSLIFAENARGKTTISAILRSIATGDPIHILERQRLGVVNPPHVVIDIDGSAVVFQNSQWSITYPDILIFDDGFIHENVHSGLIVDAAHRQNLHELIIGRDGVALARSVENLTQKIAELQTIVREKADRITPDIRGNLSVDEFCSLPSIPDIDAAIISAERRLTAIKEASFVRSIPSFEPLPLPPIETPSLQKLLNLALPDLDASSVAAVQAHFASLGEFAENWVSDGLRYLSDPDFSGSNYCPFCGQSLNGLEIVDHYRAYFAEAYKVLKSSLSEARSSIMQDLGGDALARFQRAVETTRQRFEFWSRLIDLPDFRLDLDQISKAWQEAREVIIQALDAKIAAPLENIELDHSAWSKLEAYGEVCELVLDLSRSLQSFNPEILRIKQDTEEGDLAAAQGDLQRFKVTKTRFLTEVGPLCTEYLGAKTAKEQAEQRKAIEREQLDRHRQQVIPRYQSTINELLRKFNADFRIVDVQAANPRGRPSSAYYLEINNQLIPVTGAEVPPGTPAFRSTLSSGDRNTLALAFFFAWLQHEPDLGSVIMVIDDPTSSLDDARTMATAQEIRELAGRTRQTIVMSHSKRLLCSIWHHLDPATCSALEIRRSPTGSTILPWNIHEASITEYDRRHATLRDYNAWTFTDARQVAQSLRPILEGFLRVACPEHFPPGTLLGPFINAARQKLGDPCPIIPQDDLTELDQIKEYANRFHHDTNPAWDVSVANINETELHGFVKRVLSFTKRG